jgi:hypothetical protein
MAVLFAAPDISVGDRTHNSFKAIEAFRTWFSANTDIPIKRAGKALIVRAIIDTFVMYGKETSGKGTLRHWAEGARMEGQPELAEVLEQAIPREPFRHRQWRRSLAEWRQLRARLLTDEALNAHAVGRTDV